MNLIKRILKLTSQRVTHMQSFKEIRDMVQMGLRILGRQPLNYFAYLLACLVTITKRN